MREDFPEVQGSCKEVSSMFASQILTSHLWLDRKLESLITVLPAVLTLQHARITLWGLPRLTWA